MCRMCGCYRRGHNGAGFVLTSTLCKYDLMKGDLFVLSWARVRRVRRGSISSELLMCGGGVRSILLLHLVARCLETIYVCMYVCMYMAHVCFYVCCSDCVGVCGNVCCVAAVLKDSGFFEPLGALPCAMQCCLFLGPDCSYIQQGLE